MAGRLWTLTVLLTLSLTLASCASRCGLFDRGYPLCGL